MSLRAILVVFTVVAGLLVAPCAGSDDRPAPDDFDTWYIVELAGKHAGSMRVRQQTQGGEITTSTRLRLSVRRAGAEVPVRLDCSFEETADGKPVRASATQMVGFSRTRIELRYFPDRVERTTTVGSGRPVVETDRMDATWLTPAQAAGLVRTKLREGAKEFTFRAMDLSTGMGVNLIGHKVIEKTAVESMGRMIPVYKVVLTADAETVECFVDEHGRAVSRTASFGGFTMTLTAADEAAACAGVEAPEMMTTSFIKPDRPITAPRATRRAVYRLSASEGELALDPADGVQRWTRRSPGELEVVVDLDSNAPVQLDRRARALALAPSSLVTSEDAGVKALVAKVDRARHPAPAARAEQMRRAVSSHIRNKNFQSGQASAAEVARTRSGDCSEHAVLLAAMLRADGIPARVAMGLVYADGFAGSGSAFGFHEWTQALVADEQGRERWLDLDPTLALESTFDATHIAMVTTFLDNASRNDASARLGALMGRLKISVKEIQ